MDPFHLIHCLEVVSKPQIRFKGKAQADRESAAYVQYVSIYRRPATQPLGLRWGFETTSKQIPIANKSATHYIMFSILCKVVRTALLLIYRNSLIHSDIPSDAQVFRKQMKAPASCWDFYCQSSISAILVKL